MKILTRLSRFMWVGLPLIGTAHATENRKVEVEPIETDVCNVLANPQAFVNRVIRLRGFVLLGEDHMNVSDKSCSGRGIELVIKSESTLEHKDIHQFYVRMNHQGRVGMATITGLFQADPDPLTPYVLNILKVKDVAPRSSAPHH